jgi:hypothetical protein
MRVGLIQSGHHDVIISANVTCSLLLLPILCKSPLSYCRRLTPHAQRETASKTGVCTIKNIYIHIMECCCRLVLKASTVDAETASAGNSFHSMMVDGKNDCWRIFYFSVTETDTTTSGLRWIFHMHSEFSRPAMCNNAIMIIYSQM